MGNINKVLEQANAILNEKLAQLDFLEAEKRELILLYLNANLNDKKFYEAEMKKSEEKYYNLCNEVLMLAEQVKGLKESFC